MGLLKRPAETGKTRQTKERRVYRIRASSFDVDVK